MSYFCYLHNWASPYQGCPSCVQIVTTTSDSAVMPEHTELQSLRSENARLREALERAAEVIHSDFCGRERHHALCVQTKAALEEKCLDCKNSQSPHTHALTDFIGGTIEVRLVCVREK